MDYGTQLPETQAPPHYQAAPHHYSAPPHHHHHHHPQQPQPPPHASSSSSHYLNPNPIPNPNPNPNHNNPDLAPPADAGAHRDPLPPPQAEPYFSNPYAPHGGYEDRHVAAPYSYPGLGPVTPANGAAGASYYYGGEDPHGFTVKEAIRQYGVDPLSYGVTPPIHWKTPPIPSSGLNMAVPPQMNPYIWKTNATNPNPNAISVTKKSLKRNRKVVQLAFCEVCKIDCNSQEVLSSHKQGKKHKKKVQKLKESITPKPAKAPTTPVKKKQASAADKGKVAIEQAKRKVAPAMEEDLETKKKRVLEGGAAAEEVRVCTICNVVVNSQKVFDYHITGQKHASMVKKQQLVERQKEIT